MWGSIGGSCAFSRFLLLPDFLYLKTWIDPGTSLKLYPEMNFQKKKIPTRQHRQEKKKISTLM